MKINKDCEKFGFMKAEADEGGISVEAKEDHILLTKGSQGRVFYSIEAAHSYALGYLDAIYVTDEKPEMPIFAGTRDALNSLSIKGEEL